MAIGHDFVLDIDASDNTTAQMYTEIAAAIERGLAALGIDAVFEDSTGVFAVRVADKRNLGTAYLEIRDCDMRMRIVLFEETINQNDSEMAATALRAGSR